MVMLGPPGQSPQHKRADFQPRPICDLNPPLPCMVTHAQVRGFRTWTSWGPYFPAERGSLAHSERRSARLTQCVLGAGHAQASCMEPRLRGAPRPPGSARPLAPPGARPGCGRARHRERGQGLDQLTGTKSLPVAMWPCSWGRGHSAASAPPHGGHGRPRWPVGVAGPPLPPPSGQGLPWAAEPVQDGRGTGRHVAGPAPWLWPRRRAGAGSKASADTS